ncbi:MAG TPA: DUF938 domain-containing protein [Pseudoxanthomonas sp.]|nr:DUF938 domain-containing protein [Pseudoxanthomonas sp.]
MTIDKPRSPSCERNRDPILEVLRIHFAEVRSVLEIGSGTGQHAVHFAAAMPWLQWQCTDRAEHLPGIRAWLNEALLPNTPTPVELDVAHGSWPATDFDAVFTANTLHIMGWEEVEALFVDLGEMLAFAPTEARADARSPLPPSAPRIKYGAGSSPTPRRKSPWGTRGEGFILMVYGPFNYGGAFTSDSNRDFDTSLRARDPRMGIRDFEAVDALARGAGLALVDDVAMPANNRCLVWQGGSLPPA